MQVNDYIPVIDHFFGIASIRNRGAAFGILQNQRWLFIVITIVVVSVIASYLHYQRRTGSRWLLGGLGLLLGGALGNFIERALYGEVVDFLQFTFGTYIFPIFNVADIAICVGVGMIILDSLLVIKREAKEKSAPHDN